MSETEIGTHVVYNVSGTEFKIGIEEHLECEHCESVWLSESEAEQPTCPHCGNETDRKVVSRGMMINPKFWFAGAKSPDGVAARARQQAEMMDQIADDGWEITESRDGILQLESEG